MLVTNRTARFLSPRTPAERMIRKAAIDLARRYPFGRTLVNTGRMSVASTYTRSTLAEPALSRQLQVAAEGAGRPLQNVALADPGDLVTLIRTYCRGGCSRSPPDAATAASGGSGVHCANVPLARCVVSACGPGNQAAGGAGDVPGWRPIVGGTGRCQRPCRRHWA